ncbi:MAG: hypothetical protein OEW97_04780 [Gammaproteobacteria bacterium]|nr:hypothetical protein [Gammaproteobacteria bacterium]
MKTEFVHLNKDWNAEPNAPSEEVKVKPDYVELSFYVNPWTFEGYKEEQRAAIRFYGCSRWRLGSVNDEGWYMGQCRFSKIAPKWGEFYEVKGDLHLDECPNDWNEISQNEGNAHYLFYLKDSMFECDADYYEYIIKVST